MRAMLAQLLAMDERHGGWTTSIDARRNGFTLHIRFAKPVAVSDSIDIATIFEQSNIKLCQILARVLDQIDAASQPAADAADVIVSTGA